MESEKARRLSDDPRLRLQEERGEDVSVKKQEQEGGLACPNCGCHHHSVTNTYATPNAHQNDSSRIKFSGKEYTRRRRVCENCKLPFYTREVVEPELPEEVRSPAQAAKVQKIITNTMNNVIPEVPENPYL